MRTVLLGAGGQLAFDLQRVLSDWDIIPLTHDQLDICDYQQVEEKLSSISPDMLINTAAFVRVDDCEIQVEKAFQVNAFAVRHLAQVCVDLDCALTHISTDYVFDGCKPTPYTENDLPSPLNVYGVSKLAGEYFVRNYCPKHFVVRSSGLYGLAGSSGKGGNFVETMIRLAYAGKPIRVVDDQVLTPTYTKDLAKKIRELVQTKFYGLYHVTNAGECSWFQFAVEIFNLLGIKPDLEPIKTRHYNAKARRPKHTTMSSQGIRRIGLECLRSWREALTEYFNEKHQEEFCEI